MSTEPTAPGPTAPEPTAPHRPPLTESPWFWLLLFGGVAVCSLVAISPKYARRQGGIERRFEAREEMARRQGSHAPPGADMPMEHSSAEQEPSSALRISLWPLAVWLSVVLAVALARRWWIRKRPAGEG